MQQIAEYQRQGLTHEQIRWTWYGASGELCARSTISAVVSRAGMAQQPAYNEEIPWTVRIKHQRAYQAKMLRLLGRSRTGLSLSEDERKRLRSWMQKMATQDLVVAYDPDQGFGYTQRAPEDPIHLPIHPSVATYD